MSESVEQEARRTLDRAMGKSLPDHLHARYAPLLRHHFLAALREGGTA